jgi:hypothetical protein
LHNESGCGLTCPILFCKRIVGGGGGKWASIDGAGGGRAPHDHAPENAALAVGIILGDLASMRAQQQSAETLLNDNAYRKTDLAWNGPPMRGRPPQPSKAIGWGRQPLGKLSVCGYPGGIRHSIGQIEVQTWSHAMSIVILTRPDGHKVAINSSQWQTATEDIDGGKGHNTQIGFSGPGSSIHVKETFAEVIEKLEQAERDGKESA